VAGLLTARVFSNSKDAIAKHLKKLEPAQIRDLIGYQFYAEDQTSGVLTEFGTDASEKLYWRMLNRLGRGHHQDAYRSEASGSKTNRTA